VRRCLIFSPVYGADFETEPERIVPVHLNEEQTIRWWHRNVARQSELRTAIDAIVADLERT
jgi:hypothetical protein